MHCKKYRVRSQIVRYGLLEDVLSKWQKREGPQTGRLQTNRLTIWFLVLQLKEKRNIPEKSFFFNFNKKEE